MSFLFWISIFIFSPQAQAGNTWSGHQELFGFYTPSYVESRADLSQKEIQEFALSLSQPTQEKTILYRWGHKTYETARIGQDPAFDPENVNYGQAIAGKGLYVAETPVNSIAHGMNVGDDAEIVQVAIAPGAPVLDLSDPQVLEEIRKRDLTIGEILGANPPVMIKNFQDNYWVLKTSEGVKIEKYEGKYIPTQDLFQYNSSGFIVSNLGHIAYEATDLRDQHWDKVKPILDRRIYRPGHPEIIPNPKSAEELCQLEEVESLFKNQITEQDLAPSKEVPTGKINEVLDKFSEYYWRYNGTCGRYVVNEPQIALIEDQVNPDLCRAAFPTRQTWSGSEVVIGEPRISVAEPKVAAPEYTFDDFFYERWSFLD